MRIVYDLSTQPFSVGDVLMYQQASLLFRDCERIDFIVTYDPQNPVVPDRNLSHIRSDFKGNLPWLMAAARVNRYLRTAALKTHDELKGMPPYKSWPLGVTTYHYYAIMDQMVLHYQQFGYVPALKPRDHIEQWARGYLEKHGRVTVHMRRNPQFIGRNSDYEVWRQFMCNNPDERFVVVCAPHEADDSLRLPNVRMACDDVGSDVELICGLIEASAIHMGVSSGPAVMRIFSRKPYAIFRDANNPEAVQAIRARGEELRFAWARDSQFLTAANETVGALDFELRRMNACCR